MIGVSLRQALRERRRVASILADHGKGAFA